MNLTPITLYEIEGTRSTEPGASIWACRRDFTDAITDALRYFHAYDIITIKSIKTMGIA